MYQSVDTDSQTDEQSLKPAIGQGFRRFLKSGLVLGCAVLLFILAYSYKNGAQSVAIDSTNSQAARTAYIKAISEPNAALRRARLQDFIHNNAQNPRKLAANAQLDLLNAYEVRDWNYITKIAYQDRLSHEERINALNAYTQRWGGDLLGARTQDIDALNAKILNLPDKTPKPDRRLAPSKSPIPETINSDNLAGEPQRVAVIPPPVRSTAPQVSLPPVITLPADNIIPPSIRRNVTPRYPRKALRKNIGASVVLSLNIDAKGRVQLTELVEVRAQRYQKDFIKASERAARRTRFHPQTVNGRAVPVSGVQKRYRFQP